jgi:Tfp pilus assembly protein PilF
VADSEALLGSLAFDAGLKDASVDAWRRSLRARDDAAVRIQLARALLARGDRAVAAAELELARRLDPANPELAEAQELVQAAAPAP